MGTQTLTVPSLGDAIAAVETAQTNLGNADNAQQQAQAKYDSALAGKTQADGADTDAVTAYNASLDSLITAATAAKVSRTPAPPGGG